MGRDDHGTGSRCRGPSGAGVRRNVERSRIFLGRCTLIVLSIVGNSSPAQAQDMVTAGAVVIAGKIAVDHASKRLDEVGSKLAGQVNDDLTTRLNQLGDILKNDLTRPIDDLTGEVRRAVDEVISVTNAVNGIVTRLRTCGDITVSQAVQQLGALATDFGGTSIPRSDAQPRITAIVPLDGRPLAVAPWEGPRVARRSQPRIISIRGTFTRYDASCGQSRLFASRPGYSDLGERSAVTRELAIVSQNATEVRALFPDEAFVFGGLFTFSYYFPSRSLSCDPASAFFSLLVPSEVGQFAMINISVSGFGAPPLAVLVGGIGGQNVSRRLGDEVTRRFGAVDHASWILSATVTSPLSAFSDLGTTSPAAQERTLSDPSGLTISWLPDSTGGNLNVSFPPPACRE
jgi:hypothetical protein